VKPVIGATEIEAFRGGIGRQLGLQFDDTKSGQLAEVLLARLHATGSSAADYLERLGYPLDREELGALARKLTVGETYFFRNPDQFRAFAELALPERLRRRLEAGERRLRILSAACSSGEEAFTLAILARSVLLDPSVELSIRAVDVNPGALEKAQRARFSNWALRDTPPELIRRWFRKEGNELVLDETLRSAVTFEARNLALADSALWQPGSYDVVFCRNALMYFTPEVARAVVARISEALAPGGYLFLGHAETLRGLSEDFQLCHSHGTFYYQSKAASGALPHLAASPNAHLAASPNLQLGPSQIGDPEPLPAPVQPRLMDGLDGWPLAISKAAERIAALSRTPEPPRPPPSSLAPDWDLELVLDLLRKERFLDALERMRALPPESARDPDVLLLRSVLLTHNSEFSAAEEACHRLLGIDDQNAGAHYVLALCREGVGDRRAAGERYRQAIYLSPSFAMPRLHLGLLARRSGDRVLARRELGHAIELLDGEDASRLLLFGGGFQREALLALCRAELAAVGGPR
jgi:chemotaxis protein methyltransferase CheR